MAYGSLPSSEEEEVNVTRSHHHHHEHPERRRSSEGDDDEERAFVSSERSSVSNREKRKKYVVAAAVVGAMCVAGLSSSSSSSSSSNVARFDGASLGDEAASLSSSSSSSERAASFQPSRLGRARVALASLGKKHKEDWHWEHIGNGYYCHSNAKYICEFWGSPPPPAYPFPPQMPNPPPPPSPMPPPMSPDVPSPPPPPHPMPPPLCASEAFDESSCSDEVVVRKCTSKVSENNNDDGKAGDATPKLGEEKCEDVKVPVLGYCSMQSALHKIQCQVDQTPSAHLAQSLENLCTELPAKIEAVANFTMSRMFPTDPNVLAEAFNSRFAASATASLGSAAQTLTGEEVLDIFDPDNEHVFRDSIRKLLRGDSGSKDKNSKGHEIAPLGHSTHQLGEQALIATLGGRETCFSVPVDTFPHKEMSGEFEMEWPEKLHASEYRPSMFRAQLLSPEFVSCITMNKFEIPWEVARGIVDTYRTYFKPIITKSLAQVNDATCGNNNQIGRASRMGKTEASQSKDSIEKIKAFTEEGLAGAEEKKTVVGRNLLSSEEKSKPKTYLKTTTQIPTVDLRGAADIIQREANMGGSVDHVSLVEERIMLKINNLRAQFEKDPLQDKAFNKKKESEAAEKKHSTRSLLNVENYNEAMESARMSFTNALKKTRNVDYEAELATSINFKASFKAANTMFKHGDLFDLTDTGPPVINKEEMISLGVPGVYMKTNVAARFRMPYFFKADVPGEINFHVKGDVRYKIKVSNNIASVEFLGSTIQADPEDITSSVVGSLQLGTSVRLDEFITAVCVGDLCTGPMLAMQQDAYVGFDTFDTNGYVSSQDETPTCYEGPGGLETTFVEWDYDTSAKSQCTASADDGAVKGVGSYLQVPKSPMGVYMTTLNGQAQSIWHDYHLDSGDGHFFMDELFHTCAKESDPNTYVDACEAAYLGELPMKPTKSARKAAKLAMKHHQAHSSTLKKVNVPKPAVAQSDAKPATVAQTKPAAASKPAAEAATAKPAVAAATTKPAVAAATAKPAVAASKPAAEAATAKPAAVTAPTKTPTVVTAKAAPVRPDGVYEKKPDGMMHLIATERKIPEQEKAPKQKVEEAKKAAEAKVAAAEKKVEEAKKAADVKKVNVQSKIAADQVNAAMKVMKDVKQQQQQRQPKQQQSKNNIKMIPINEEAKNLQKRLDSVEASMGRERLEKNLEVEKLARGIPDLPEQTKVSAKKSSRAVRSEIFIDDIAAQIADEASTEDGA